MRSGKFIVLLLMLAIVAGCGGGGSAASNTLVSIAITPVNPSITIGGAQQFTATGTFSDGTTQDLTSSVTWSSANTAVATISNTAGSNGAAAAVAAGTAKITATSGNVSASTTLTVTTLVKITLQPANPTIALDTSQQFSAIGTFSDNTTQDLTSSVTWSSFNTAVATISNTAGSNGAATAVAAGTTTIMAASGNVSASTTLTVSSATLNSIAIQPASPTVAVGGTQQFTATGTFSDKTTQNLTTLVAWSSSNTAVATISNTAGSNGAASAVAAGTATITATMAVTQPIAGFISGTANLTVVSGGSGGQANVVPITVNGSLCSSGALSYPNKPCVSVTICSPGTSTCQTIDNILLDTGSYGLRILSQALTVPLTPVASGSGLLAECVQFGDDTSEWGPVQMASVILGAETTAFPIPVHVVNQSFGTPPSGCTSPNSTPDTSPFEAGFNGILGVGLFAQDCGSLCTNSTNTGGNPLYYSCIGTTCTATAVPIANQVSNPVAALPVDNNGVLVQLPSVALGGVPYVNGSLVLGIGTQTNNQPTTATKYPADPNTGQFTTRFDGQTFTDASFIDSGSNGLFFAAPRGLIAQCSSFSTGSGYFCPSSTTLFSATNSGYSGSPTGTVSFEIGNATTLFDTSNNVFIELGANSSDFDWGLPFFFGRNVFVGIEGKSSSLGAGPYWAY